MNEYTYKDTLQTILKWLNGDEKAATTIGEHEGIQGFVETALEQIELYDKNNPRTKLLEVLYEVRDTATMERSGFGQIHQPQNPGYPTEEGQVTDFIRERTDLWRRSWIIGPLNGVIDSLEVGADKI